MATSVATRVQKRRSALRAAGMRPIQIWVPDTRQPGFAQECHRQAVLVAQAEVGDTELAGFMDAALRDVLDDHPT